MKLINDAKTFDETIANGKVVVDFFATWCGPCKMVAPILEGLSQEYSEVTFFKVDVDEAQELARRYGVMSIPTLLFFKDGKLFDKVIGAMGKPALSAKVKALI